MADVRLQIPDEMLTRFQEKLGSRTKATNIAEDAMTLYEWAVSERAKGNQILSSDPSGEKITRITMPSLASVREI